MDEAARLSRLLGELAVDPRYASGKRFPRKVPRADLLAIVAALQGEVHKGTEARAAHHAMGGDRCRPSALCDAVAARL